MNAVLALARKDLKLLLRDRFALFWILAFPLMFALFFGAIFGSEGDDGRGALPVGVVDEDHSDASRDLLERLAGNDSVHLERAGEAADAPLATLSLEEAREAVQKGRKVAYLRIPSGYGENPYAVFGSGGEDVPGLEVGIDPGRRAEAGFLQGVLMESVFGALQDRFTDKAVLHDDLSTARKKIETAEDLNGGQKLLLQTFMGAVDHFVQQFDMDLIRKQSGSGEEGVGQSIEVVDVTRDRDNEPRSTFDVTFPQAMVWGLMSVAMAFAITMVRERSSGTLLRLRMAPLGRAHLLAGKALGCFLGCVATMVVLMVFAAVALRVRFDSLPLLGLGVVCTAACFTGLMMTMSVLGKTEAAVAGASWGLMMPFAMVGGGMIPLIAMPGWLAKASVVSPFKWAITAIEGAVWRGFTLADMALPCALLLGMGALFFVVGVAIFRKVDG